jgi:hypothetical protein
LGIRQRKARVITEEFLWAPWTAAHLTDMCGRPGVCCFIWTCGAYTPKHMPKIPGVAEGLISFVWGGEYCTSMFPLRMQSLHSKTGLRTLSTKPSEKVAVATGRRVDQIGLIDDSDDRVLFNPAFSMLLTPTYRPGMLSADAGTLQVPPHLTVQPPRFVRTQGAHLSHQS